MKKQLLILICFLFSIAAKEPPAQPVSQDFEPWYTGPLVTPSATMIPPGIILLQPYVVLNSLYRSFNAERKQVPITPGEKLQLGEILILQAGLNDWMDLTTILSYTYQWQVSQGGGGFGDLPVSLGIKIMDETDKRPKIKLSLQESFPTGRFQNLSHNGLALGGLGSGSFATRLGIALGKMFFKNSAYPLSIRAFFSYTIPTNVHAEGYNVYGGGIGTDGTVNIGDTFSANLGGELCLTKNWALACDLTYITQQKTTFDGTLGTTATGASASMGSGSNDSLTIVPAIEYNWSSSLGVIGGVQCGVYGRNSPVFISGQISVVYSFPVGSK